MNNPPSATATMSTRTFRDWSQSRPLAESLTRAEAQVRARPQDANERWLLFELLCELAQWDRALVQLRSWAGLASHPGSVADVMRGLIMAERQRGEVFSGRGRPAPMSVGDEATCEWMTAMGRALKLAAGKDAAALEASDAVRESALAQATETPGSSNLQPAFAWISDSDSRLGPVCEVMVAGTYRWLAFADLAAVEKDAPSSLLDLVWSNAAVRLRDGTVLDCHLPMRYPVHADDRDALRLGRETVWAEIGRTGVFARGQKTWTSDLGDMPLFDLRRCIFGTEPGNGAQTASAEGEGHAEH